MTRTTCHILPPKALTALARDRLDKWTPVPTPLSQGSAPRPITLWDTFDQALRRSGRLLWEAEGRFGLLDGPEVFEQSSARGGNFVADFAPGPVRDALADLSPLHCLLPLAAGHLTEAQLALTDSLGKTCARAELRLFAVGQGALQVRLRPLRGYDKAFKALHSLIAPQAAPGALADRLIEAPPVGLKPEVEIAASDSAFEAATRIVAAHLPGVRAHEPGILADHDTEFLHQYRIGLRKIRLTLGLFDGVYRPDRTTALRQGFAGLMQATGRLRDLDVALLAKGAAFEALPSSLHGGLEALYAALGQDRAAALAEMRAHLQSPAYAAEIAALTRPFAKPRLLAPGKLADAAALDLALKLMRARHRKIGAAVAALSDETPDEVLHLIRLHLKKLRYLMEFFAPHLPPLPYRTIRKAIKGLQDALGQINDDAQQGLRLQDALARHPSLPLAQSTGALLALLHGRRAPSRAAAMAGLAAFAGAEMQAQFQALTQETP